MNGYQLFAAYYDKLTSNISYEQRGAYFHAIFEKFGLPGNILLDLACGTGSLSEVMAGLGYDVIGTDASEEMLMEAMNKKYRSGRDILYLCQSMEELDLYGTVDGCVCALDSLNHLTDPAAVQRAFERVSLFLAPGGLFVFDVNSPYKQQQVLSDRAFVYELPDLYCVWQNSVCEDLQVEITLDFFSRKGSRYERQTETFCERAYTHEELSGFLEKAGLTLLARYGDDSWDAPGETAQRWIYVTRSAKQCR